MKNFLIIPFFTFLLGSDMTVFSKPFYECDEKKFSTEYLVKNSMSGILHIDVKGPDSSGIGSGFIVGYQEVINIKCFLWKPPQEKIFFSISENIIE